jgi:uncharacterized protein
MMKLHLLKYFFQMLTVIFFFGKTAFAFTTSFEKTPLQIGLHVISAEIANTNNERMQGLMHRQFLPKNQGMIFVFEQTGRHCMWMRNTLIPLSVAFIDQNGVIINIADMQPLSEMQHCALTAAKFALEMNQGWFNQRGIQPGQQVVGVTTLKSQ